MNHSTKDKILLCDSTLREGEQSYGVFFSQSAKIQIAKLLFLAGVDMIEIGHLAAAKSIESAGRSICKELPKGNFLAHALPRKEEIELALDVGAKWIGFFLTVDKGLAALKYHTSPQQLLDRVETSIKTAKEWGLSVRFTCEDASRTPQNLLFRVFQRMMAAGADLLGYADTVGCLYPNEFSGVARDIVSRFGTNILHFHGHNDNGMALANAVVALNAGFYSIDSTVWGIGERMGIVSLTDLVIYLMKHDLLKGFDAKLLGDLETLVAAHIDCRKHFSRRFAHKAGLHCASAAREPKTYELVPAESLGWKRRFVFSKLSGHESIKAVLAKSKIPENDADIERCLEALKHMDTEEVISLGALCARFSRKKGHIRAKDPDVNVRVVDEKITSAKPQRKRSKDEAL